jgi:hypothetical protein
MGNLEILSLVWLATNQSGDQKIRRNRCEVMRGVLQVPLPKRPGDIDRMGRGRRLRISQKRKREVVGDAPITFNWRESAT